MFTLFKIYLLKWFYTPRESSLGGLTGGYSVEDSLEDPLEETKFEEEDYDRLYDEQMNLNHSLVFP
jgi:hypothetical protein